MNNIISINIQATEYFDKINGNSYFSANIQVITKKDNEKPEEKNIYIPCKINQNPSKLIKL